MSRSIFSIIALSFAVTCGSAIGQVQFDYQIKSDNNQISQAGFSPDGETFVVANKNMLDIYAAGTPTRTRQLETEFYRVTGFQLIDENTAITWGVNASGTYRNFANIYDLESLQVKEKIDFSGNLEQHYQLRRLAKDKYLLVGNNGVSLKDGDEFRILEKIPGDVFCMSTSKASELIILGHRSGDVTFLDYRSLEIKKTVKVSDNTISAVSVSNSGLVALAGDMNGNIKRIKIDEDYKVVPLQANHKEEIFCTNFSLDSKYFVTADKKQLYVWKTEKSVIVFETKIKNSGAISSVNFDPKGRYFAATGFLSKKVVFYNCAGLSITPYIELKDEDDKTPPQLLVTNPSIKGDKVTLADEKVNIHGVVIDDRGVQNVTLNGEKVTLTESGDFDVEVALSPGDNPFQLEATDINGNTALKKFSIIRRDLDISDLSFESKNYMLMIAIDQYNGWPELNNAVTDAGRFEDVLKRKYGFQDNDIHKVVNADATRQGIINGFRNLIENTGPNDNIIIYYSGHGYFDATLGEGYWIPVDAEKGNDGDYVPNSFILQLIKKVQAKHVFLVADACFSGSLFNESHRGYTENVGKYKSRWGLASGRLEFVSDGEAGTQSPFNKHLCDYLENHGDEEFSVSELIQHVKKEVANETHQAPVGNPLRNTGDEGGEFIFKKVKE